MNDFDLLYRRVNRVCPVEREEFDDLLAYAKGKICALCGKKYVFVNAVDDSDGVFGEYEGALASAILYCLRGEREDAEAFMERVKYAFGEIWRQRAYAAKKKEAGA